ncbi:hypothetical protein [Flavonifractor plautii]|uniref:hypothetical protein n=1 Tax=Flavonifractor plautii TaxID=292800 RepID=UPI003566E898
MANRIKGITVQIGGDTTKLDKALSEVNQTLRTTQADLNDVNRLLKLDPKNVTLLAQKQKALTKAIEETKKKLTTLKTAADQASDALAQGTITSEQYDALQREIVQTTEDLESLERQAKETGRKLGDFGVSAEEVSSKAKSLSDKTKGLTTAVAAVGAAALATIPATEEFRESMSKLEANVMEAGTSMEKAKESFKQFNAVSGEVDSSVEALSNLLQAGFTDNQLAVAVDALSGAVVRFPDTLKIESLADSLQETIATGSATGQFAELLDRVGIGADNLSKAMEGVTSETDRQNLALSALASTGLAESYEAWAQENQVLVESRNSQIELQEQMSQLAEAIMPLATRVTELATNFLNWFNSLSSGSKTAIVAFAAILAAISPVSGAISTLSNIMSHASTIFTTTNAKILIVVAAIAALSMVIAKLADAWSNMNGIEKVAAVLGVVAAAAFTAAVAVGAFQSAATLGIAALAIAAGIAAVVLAINSAQARAQELSNSANQIPKLADGAVIAPNKPFLAMLGDQTSGTNIETPLSTMKQAFDESLNERGGVSSGGTLYATLQVDGVTFARLVAPYMDRENVRRGVTLVEG